MRYILAKILTAIAKIYLNHYKPVVIAVTGNVGKTSTKEAIGAVMKAKYSIRMNGGNLNNELGLPLTIIGDWVHDYYSQGGTILFWLKVIFEGILRVFIPKTKYPQVLVLEYAADHPGDIEKLVKDFRPDVGVITAIGKIPVHIEFFKDAEHLADEKSNLIKYLKFNEFAVLNYDDPSVMDMQVKTKAHILTYGFGEGAQIKVSEPSLFLDQQGDPAGIEFEISKDGESEKFKILGSLGRAQAISTASAVAVGSIFKISLQDMAKHLAEHSGPAGRLRILKGVKNSLILDDSYNASPASMQMALETLKAIPKYSAERRKIAVLGDMLELGQYSTEAHQAVGNMVAEFADYLFCVGERAKFIADSAANQMPLDHIFTFHNSNDAKSKVQEIIKSGDIVLVKGSQGMRMEKIVAEIMARPDLKKELLVRQSKTWLAKE